MRDFSMVSPDLLRQLLRYEPETGKLFWLPRGPEWFIQQRRSAEASAETWNARFAGREAFTCVQKGYLTGRIFAAPYRAHRVIWAIMTGEWPPEHVDHVNHDRSDNRWVNLRSVTNSENHQNMALRRDNSSGCAGVAWDRRRNCWRARIHVGGHDIHLGYFQTRDEAFAERTAAVLRHGYHENHGAWG